MWSSSKRQTTDRHMWVFRMRGEWTTVKRRSTSSAMYYNTIDFLVKIWLFVNLQIFAVSCASVQQVHHPMIMMIQLTSSLSAFLRYPVVFIHFHSLPLIIYSFLTAGESSCRNLMLDDARKIVNRHSSHLMCAVSVRHQKEDTDSRFCWWGCFDKKKFTKLTVNKEAENITHTIEGCQWISFP